MKPCGVCGGTERTPNGTCRACKARYRRTYRKAHPEQERAANNAWNATNRERIRAQKAAWRAKNRVRQEITCRECGAEVPDRPGRGAKPRYCSERCRNAANNAWNAANIERIRAKQKAYRARRIAERPPRVFACQECGAEVQKRPGRGTNPRYCSERCRKDATNRAQRRKRVVFGPERRLARRLARMEAYREWRLAHPLPCRKCGVTDRDPQGQCRPCKAARKRAYSLANREKVRVRRNKYRAATRERRHEVDRKRYAAIREANPEKMKEGFRLRAWYLRQQIMRRLSHKFVVEVAAMIEERTTP